MTTREIRIDKDGRVRHERIDANVALLVEMGRINPEDAGKVRKAFHDDYEGTIRQVTATGISEDAALNYLRASGVLSMRDDPRVRRSWER